MRLWICAAAVNGFLSVAMGAHAAHSLRGRAAPEAVGWVELGAEYGIVHALALLGIALLVGRPAPTSRLLDLAGWGFLAGCVLFSGALYVMGMSGWRGLGILVPIGGLSFMAGWLVLLGYGVTYRAAA